MENKIFAKTEEEYEKLFYTQFSDEKKAKQNWENTNKPLSYPCVVIKGCGKYTYVYLNDFKLTM